MFDFIKRIFGLAGCRGCVHRRCGGLYCGRKPRYGHFKPAPWGRYGCWHYASGPVRKEGA